MRYISLSCLGFVLALIWSNLTSAQIVGNEAFVHLEKTNGIWWLVNHEGQPFVTTGMNHIGEGSVFFNEVNQGWLTGEFGEDIRGAWGGLNPRAKNIGGLVDMIVRDHKAYGFNTIPFHVYGIPYPLLEERGIYFVAKIKVASISLMQMNRKKGQRFPDVFSKQFFRKLDRLAEKTCVPLRNSKYCLGYSYFDTPELKPIRKWQSHLFPDKGQVYPANESAVGWHRGESKQDK